MIQGRFAPLVGPAESEIRFRTDAFLSDCATPGRARAGGNTGVKCFRRSPDAEKTREKQCGREVNFGEDPNKMVQRHGHAAEIGEFCRSGHMRKIVIRVNVDNDPERILMVGRKFARSSAAIADRIYSFGFLVIPLAET